MNLYTSGKIAAILLLPFLLSHYSSGKTEETEVEKPNVIFIYTDDLGYGDLTCYNPESKIITPHIDRLADEGMLFKDAHSSASICTPSRYSLLTGRYCWRSKHKYGVLGGYDLPIIERERLTLGKLFQDAGYRTAAIGKWHLGMEWTLAMGNSTENQEERTVDHHKPILDSPLDHGFDYFFGTSGCPSDDPPFAFIENRRILGLPLKLQIDLDVTGEGDYMDVLTTKDWEHEKVDTIFTNRAIRFMDQRPGEKAPFFIYLALSLPHIPWKPAGFVKGTTGAGPRGDLIALADYCVGQIDSALKELGIRENSIVIFSSDNGPREGINGHNSAGLLRGYKESVYEGGHRVPLIARWPGVVPAGSVSNQTVCLTDFMSTFANILGIEIPEGEVEDSYSILPVLLNRAARVPVRSSTVHHNGRESFALRKGEWKLVYPELAYGTDPGLKLEWPENGELYNLDEDPSEKFDVSSEYPEKYREMELLLFKTLRDQE